MFTEKGAELVTVGRGTSVVSDVQKIAHLLDLTAEEVSTRPLSWVYEELVLLAVRKKENSAFPIPEVVMVRWPGRGEV